MEKKTSHKTSWSKYLPFEKKIKHMAEADPGPWRDPCVVAAMDKFTWTTQSCGGKGTAWPLSREEYPDPCLDRLLLLFWAHYIEDGPHLLCTGSP